MSLLPLGSVAQLMNHDLQKVEGQCNGRIEDGVSTDETRGEDPHRTPAGATTNSLTAST